jgi:thiamine transport system substrate-binding protein
MNTKRFSFFVMVIIMLTACAPQPAAEQPGQPSPAETSIQPQTLVIYTHDSFDISEDVVQAFQEANNADVRFIAGGDTGTALNKLILSKGNPPADVFYGVDNTFLSRALQEDIFIPYQSSLLEVIPDEFELDPEFRALPVDFGDVCLNYDKSYFAENSLDVPQSLEDLLKPEYKSLLVVQNPATSSPGLAFLLATIAHFGDPGYLEFWQSLAENDVKVVNDWETAYYTEFSRWEGTRPIVVSYGSSPPFDVVFAEVPMDEPPTGAIVADDTCFRQIEFVGILQGTQNEALARKWVDFMLSVQFQEDLPLKMFVFPVNQDAQLDEVFKKFLAIPEKPAQLSLEEIAANRENWIRAWTDLILR